MAKDTEKSKKENKEEVKKQEKADPGTTNSTDPQENMEGPVSSLMHTIEESFEKPDKNKPRAK